MAKQRMQKYVDSGSNLLKKIGQLRFAAALERAICFLSVCVNVINRRSDSVLPIVFATETFVPL